MIMVSGLWQKKKDKQKQTTILKSLITDKYYQAHWQMVKQYTDHMEMT